MRHLAQNKSGFTLLEMSVVLVIIGLLAGGIMVGQDMIYAATVRAQIRQLDKYNVAVQVFRQKYGEIPGDMLATTASTFGFATRAGTWSHGDGDGIIYPGMTSWNPVTGYIAGETALFFADLSQTKFLDDGPYLGVDCKPPTDTNATPVATCTVSSSTTPVASIVPPAKMGKTNYIVPQSSYTQVANMDIGNYFFIVRITGINSTGTIANYTTDNGEGLTPLDAYAIDSKIDDGYPSSGNVMVWSLTLGTAWYAAAAGYCAKSTVTPYVYNTATASSASAVLCPLAIAMQ